MIARISHVVRVGLWRPAPFKIKNPVAFFDLFFLFHRSGAHRPMCAGFTHAERDRGAQHEGHGGPQGVFFFIFRKKKNTGGSVLVSGQIGC